MSRSDALPVPTRAWSRPRRLHALALACVLLMLVVTGASAWLRLAQPRPVCQDWPGCRGAAQVAAPVRPAAAPPGLEAIARLAHRAAASSVLLASLALVVLAAKGTAKGTANDATNHRIARRHGAALLGAALALAALGIVTPGSTALPVTLGNLMGGLAMVAIAWRMWRALRGPAPLPPAARRLAAAAALLWLVQAGLGGASGTGLREAAPVAHLLIASAALPLAGAAAWAARRHGRAREAAALATLAVLQALLGSAAVASAATPVAVWVHNVAAALGLALLAGLTVGPRRADPRAP